MHFRTRTSIVARWSNVGVFSTVGQSRQILQTFCIGELFFSPGSLRNSLLQNSSAGSVVSVTRRHHQLHDPRQYMCLFLLYLNEDRQALWHTVTLTPINILWDFEL